MSARVKHEITVTGTGALTVAQLNAALKEVQDKPDARVEIREHQATDMRDSTYWTLKVSW